MLRRSIAVLAIIHPFPTALNTALVVILGTLAGAAPEAALALGAGMFGFQASIGALNDVVDEPVDRRDQPSKPIPAGVMSLRTARIVSIVGGLLGLVVSATFGVGVLVMGIIGYGSGIAYDIGMRRVGLGWVCFAVAFPALLAWTWVAATGVLPPGWRVLLPMAAFAGPAIHLANALVDPASDTASGVRTLATQLGPRRALRVLVLLQLAIMALAWMTLLALGMLDAAVVTVAAIGSALIAAGVALSNHVSKERRTIGWMAQAVGLGAFAVAWLTAAAIV